MKCVLLSALAVVALGATLWADPPARVGRLAYIDGNVSFASAPGSAWQAATQNYPLTTGNQVSAAAMARAEIQIGSAVLRIAPETAVSFETLDDQVVQVRLDKGRASVRLHRLGPDQSFVIDIPTASISLSAPGSYRIEQASSGNASIIARAGDALVTGGETSFHVRGGQMADIPASQPDAYRISSAPPRDAWDEWVSQRDVQDNPSTHYVSSEMDGAADLDQYGTWQVVDGYGPVWYPDTVVVGWAPYTFGSWAWIEPWGWTWVDNEPWGFAPFHYGRWALLAGAWCWVPGPIAARPIYAPALVRWVGGAPLPGRPPGQGGVTWVPLGPRQVFQPAYTVSTRYFRAVNGATVLRPRPAAVATSGVPHGPWSAISGVPNRPWSRQPGPGVLSPAPFRPRPAFTGRPPYEKDPMFGGFFPFGGGFFSDPNGQLIRRGSPQQDRWIPARP